MENDFPSDEMTYALRGAIFDVRNELKAGWSEHVYHHALERLLHARGYPVTSKPRRTLVHRGIEIHQFEPDLIVWDAVILELKVLPYSKQFAGEHFAQLIHYLKFFKKRLGFLVDFAPAKVRIKRVVWREPAENLDERFRKNSSSLSSLDVDLLDAVRDVVVDIGRLFGLGYSDGVYRKLLAVELAHRGFVVEPDIEIPALWRQRTLAIQRMPFIEINNRVLLHICALSGPPSTYEFARLKTALASLGLPFALLVNFSFRQLQIFGVKPE